MRSPKAETRGASVNKRPSLVSLKDTSRRMKASTETAATVARVSVAGVRRNFRLAGALKNSRLTRTVVPRRRAVGCTSLRRPPSTMRRVASDEAPFSSAAVSSSNFETDAMAASASPRKPSVATPMRSEADVILLVACRSIASTASSRSIPVPSSLTVMDVFPPASNAISMAVAPASNAFSMSSLTTDAGRSTTSPAAI